MLRRKIYDQLLEWKGRKHSCLLIKGQRQVGKTFIVEYFAKQNYKNIFEINFANNPEYCSMFKEERDVDSLIGKFAINTGRTDIIPGKTLIFFDEIQECPNARSSLKQFSIDGRYDVIASGSLLGIEDSRITKKKKDEDSKEKEEEIPPLLPMGYEEHITMYSMDFEEFLWAFGVPDNIIDDAKSRILNKKPFGESLLDGFGRRFRDWMITGGMPEAVEAYVEKGSWMYSNKVIGKNIDTCIQDITRYVKSNEKTKTLECFRSIPDQLGETNKRFMFSRLGDGNSRSTRDKYGENLLWIGHAGYANLCYNISQPAKPLRPHTIRDSFKVYMSDTGSLAYLMGSGTQASIAEQDLSYNNGAIVENAVAECLMKSGIKPRYFNKANGPAKMEIDFIFMLDKELIAAEVKSGKTRSAPSITKLPKFYKVDRRIMFENGDIYVDEDGLEHYPLFAAAFVTSLSEPYEPPKWWDEPCSI